ncbi:MAG TPA: FAD-dependent oxidoreductase [Thermoanaerobaculia bacterium]|jgi:NADPH-dependent 2,4-dienoyl-CoA reductase/sulfur reductase-like enzyme/nitrite reductase/ring-hydroxylating ferredoxin subunit|nr:FAD-dependent oxidoreductase [Thermoanaerobaculia bacterium]
MGGEAERSGPDLAQGIPLADLPDGGQLAGHFGDEPVLLVRRGEVIFAVGASCTHYGGPLAEGIVVDDTVRCPWHHACFSLRTGEAVRAPALNPVAVYKVERDGDRILVREKVEPAAPLHAPRKEDLASVVIVGAGAAGNCVAETLRREGYSGRIVVLAPEGEPPYDRPNLSKDYLAGNAPEDWIPLHPRDFYDEHGIELRKAEATAVDPKAKTVTLSDGTSLGYGALVLATGAEPIRLPIPGADLPHVHVLRSLADSRSLIEASKSARRALVVGASFIGLETAASLRARNMDVTVVAPEEQPLGKILGPQLGGFIRSLHEEHGVVFKLGTKPKAILKDGVELESGETVPADLVVLGVGVKPRLALAEAAGLDVDNGVLVDGHLQTSSPGIYAVGDIASWPDPHSGQRLRVEHWVVAERQGQAVARSILGRGEPFAAVPFFWSQHYDVTISYVGHAAKWDSIEVSGSIEDRNATITYREAGRIAAVATIFRDRESLEAELAMERDDPAELGRIVAR